MPDNAVWAANGPETDARMARELAWVASGGQTGIVGPWSCRVLAQSVPNGTVRIMPGGFTVAATSQFAAIGYSSAPWQSYMRSVYEPITVSIDPTGSSGARTDVVGIVIDDPEFEGTSPDPDSHQYWRPHVVRNAGNNATRPEHFASLGRPFLPLAQVRIPANTGTITNAMITDIRFLAVARTTTVARWGIQEVQRTIDASNEYRDLFTITGIQVPQWATYCHISGSASGLIVVGSGRMSGTLRGRLNSNSSRSGYVTYFREEGTDNGLRLHLPIQGHAWLEPAERGATLDFTFQGFRTTGNNFLRAEPEFARYDLTLTFTEEPVME